MSMTQEDSSELMKDLRKAKSDIRELILINDAPGINGVALCQKRRALLIFYTDEGRAQEFLSKQFEKLMPHIKTRPGAPTQKEAPRAKRQDTGLLSKILALIEKVKVLRGMTPIRPSSVISADEPGLVGCFLSIRDPNNPKTPGIGVLTADHLFHSKRETKPTDPHDVRVTDNNGQDKEAGWRWRFATVEGDPLKADCALFKPDLSLLKLKKSPKMTGAYILVNHLEDTESHPVKNLIDGIEATICDTSATIRCIEMNGSSRPLDQQILVEGQDFGFKGYSGGIILMAKTVQNGISDGDAVGIYVYTCAGEFYHFLTPMHECIATFSDVTGIYQP